MSQQIERTLEILELLADHPAGVALTDIASRLNLPKSTTARLLFELVDREYLTQDEGSQRYRLTLRLVALGFRYLTNAGLTDVCQPELDRLAQATSELARIAVVDGDNLVWIAEAQGAIHGLRYDAQFGRCAWLSATGTGKAWLATMSDQDAVAIVLRQGFGERGKTVGPRALQSIPELLEVLEQTRKQGYGIAFEEGEAGMAAVAAVIPPPTPGEACVGTVSVAGPSTRMSVEALHKIAPLVQASAKRISQLWPIRRHQRAAVKKTEDILEGARL